MKYLKTEKSEEMEIIVEEVRAEGQIQEMYRWKIIEIPERKREMDGELITE